MIYDAQYKISSSREYVATKVGVSISASDRSSEGEHPHHQVYISRWSNTSYILIGLANLQRHYGLQHMVRV